MKQGHWRVLTPVVPVGSIYSSHVDSPDVQQLTTLAHSACTPAGVVDQRFLGSRRSPLNRAGHMDAEEADEWRRRAVAGWRIRLPSEVRET